MQEDTVYTSEVRIERVKGPLRRAYLPGNDQPVLFGVHSAVAEHYKVNIEEHEPHTTTLDYVVAAAAGWLTGTLGGALEARKIPAGDGLLYAEAQGNVGKDGSVLIIRSIRVKYHLKLKAEHREIAERVHGFHKDKCPVARSISGCIKIGTELQLEYI